MFFDGDVAADDEQARFGDRRRRARRRRPGVGAAPRGRHARLQGRPRPERVRHHEPQRHPHLRLRPELLLSRPIAAAVNKPLGPYCPFVRAGDFIIVSGQGGMLDGVDRRRWRRRPDDADDAPTSPTGSPRPAPTLTDVVKTLCFLTDMGTFAEFNEAYAAAFGDHRPARSTVGRRPRCRAAWTSRSRPGRTSRRDRAAVTDAAALRLGRRRPPARRRRTTTPSGACPQRDPRRLFEFAHPRGRPGRAVVVHDPRTSATATARRSPASIPCVVAAFGDDDVEPAASPTRASCATGPRSTATVGNARAWLELDDPVGFLWGFVDGAPVQNRCDHAAPRCRPATSGRTAMSKELQAARLPLRRPDDLLRADAGVRPRQRPRHRPASATPSAPRLRRAEPSTAWPARSSSSSCSCSSRCSC